ncbi:MAG: hypothetical protein MRY21_00190 [Simkaniaceae bacterium]|nr:hypothetical protein [Simkaniaceae bacterium]
MKSKLPENLLSTTLWADPKNPIWLTTRFRLRRNLNHNLFPGKMTKAQLTRAFDSLIQSVQGTEFFGAGSLISADTLSPVEKDFLIEHYLISDEIDETRPGQGIFFDQTQKRIALLNFGDHLCIDCFETGSDWDQIMSMLQSVEKLMGEKLEFAYSETFGFLTSDPSMCGTALTVETYLHLPALIQEDRLNSLLDDIEEDVVAQGPGHHPEFIGNIVMLSNRYTVGVSEETILEDVHRAATMLEAQERKSREKLKKSGADCVKDAVARSYGVLRHSFQLGTLESLEALSLLLLGADIDWVEGIDQKLASELFFNCRKGHLALLREVEGEKEAVRKARATFFHESLNEAKLNL